MLGEKEREGEKRERERERREKRGGSRIQAWRSISFLVSESIFFSFLLARDCW